MTSKSKSNAPMSVDLEGLDPALAEWHATVPIARLQMVEPRARRNRSRANRVRHRERIAMSATAKTLDDDEMIDTGRPWPFHFTLEIHPFEQRLTVHVTVDAASGGMTPAEAETCALSIDVARDIARRHADGPTLWD